MRKDMTVKKLILGIAALMFIVMNSPAMAGLAVPKNLCLDWTAFSDVNQLLIKSQGTVKSADGPVKMFSIFGHAFNGARLPIVGNGYVVPGTTTFHGTFTGNYRLGGNSFAGNWELFYDIFLQTGTIFFHYDQTNGSKIAGSSGVVLTTCANLPVPAITVGAGQKFSSEQ
jgi:hypothetical protein